MAGIEFDGVNNKIELNSGAAAADQHILFNGNAQDFYIALDDSADDLIVGLGSTIGTTPIISLTEAGAVTLKNVGTGDDNPMTLTLQTSETDMAADDVIGKIAFQAPDEGTGTDAILVSAAIQARAEGDHSSSSNATSIDFLTGASEAAAKKLSITSAGHFIPSADNTYDIGTSSLEFKDGYFDGTLYCDTLNLAGTNYTSVAAGLAGIDDQTSSNDDQVTITDSAVIINEDSDDLDFRVESDDNANMIFVDGAEDHVNIGTATDGGGTLNVNGVINYLESDTLIGGITSSSSDLILRATVSDKDMKFTGNDGGSTITALTFDMSAAGAATFNAGVTVGGNVVVPDGNGIDFSATGDGSGTDTSELLDDYEEGTWTPAIANVTTNSARGKYTKVGRNVTIHLYMDISGGSLDTTVASISGIPYANGDHEAIGSVMYTNVDHASSDTLVAYLNASVSVIKFYISTDDAAWASIQTNNFASNTGFFVSLTYEA